MSKVYSGLYEFSGHVVPYLVIVKIGKPSEHSWPGNHGKHDSDGDQAFLEQGEYSHGDYGGWLNLHRSISIRRWTPLSWRCATRSRMLLVSTRCSLSTCLRLMQIRQWCLIPSIVWFLCKCILTRPVTANWWLYSCIHDKKVLGVCGETHQEKHYFCLWYK